MAGGVGVEPTLGRLTVCCLTVRLPAIIHRNGFLSNVIQHDNLRILKYIFEILLNTLPKNGLFHYWQDQNLFLLD